MVGLLAPLLADALGTSVALATGALMGWVAVHSINRLRAAL